MAYKNENTESFLAEIGLDASHQNAFLSVLDQVDDKYIRDAKLNFKSILKPTNLNDEEIALIGLSVAANLQNKALTAFFLDRCKTANIDEDVISEAVSCASLLATNNVFYRFRHFVKKDIYSQLPAGIRMGIMMSPKCGKKLFELMSLAVSAINGCEMCVNSHEKSLIELGVEEKQIYDVVRIASILTGISKLV